MSLIDKAQPYIPIAQQASQDTGVPLPLLLGVLATESGFDPNARAKGSTAKGIGQFIDATAKQYGINALDPNQAIPATAKYLANNQKLLGSWDKAVAGYNLGPGAIQNANGIPNQGYVNTVNKYSQMFGGQSMTPHSIVPILPSDTSQQQQQTPFDPTSLIPQQAPGLSGGMRTLLTVLASIGSIGGTAANIVGGIHSGNSGIGNSSIAQSGGILDMLAKQSEQQNQYDTLRQQVSALAPTNPQAATALAVGDKSGLADLLNPQTQQIKGLQLQRLQQDVNAGTPEGIAAAQQQKLDLLKGEANAKETSKSNQDAADAEEMAKLANTPNKTEQQAFRFAQLRAKMPVEKVYSALVDPDKGAASNYNTAAHDIKILNRMTTILQDLPTSNLARFQGKALETWNKIDPKVNVTELMMLQTILSRPFVRSGLHEKGRISQQEYENVNKLIFNFLSKSPQERNVMIGDLKDIYKQNLMENYNHGNFIGSSIGEPNIMKNDPNLIDIQPEEVLKSMDQTQTQGLSQSEIDLLKKHGGMQK